MDPLKLATDAARLASDIAKAVDREGAGGAKVTPAEWAAIGKDVAALAVDVARLAAPHHQG